MIDLKAIRDGDHVRVDGGITGDEDSLLAESLAVIKAISDTFWDMGGDSHRVFIRTLDANFDEIILGGNGLEQSEWESQDLS